MRIVLAFAAMTVMAACQPPPRQTPVTDAAAPVAIVATPAADARVSSPLRVSGTAPADWYFENQFPVRLVDVQGEEMAFAPATPRVNWTEPGDKPFDAELTFDVSAETPATLVLEEDMLGDNAAPRQVRIPVVLIPNG